MSFFRSLFLLVLALSSGAQTYGIDASCPAASSAEGKIIRAELDHAFLIAKEASLALDKVLLNSTDQVDKVQALAWWVFGYNNEENRWKKASCKSLVMHYAKFD